MKFVILFFVNQMSLIVSTEVIGDYPELNGDKCGVSRVSQDTIGYPCLQWHKHSPNQHIRDGYNATVGAAPWAVFIWLKLSMIPE